MNKRFDITAPHGDGIKVLKWAFYLRHIYVDLTCQHWYQLAAGDEAGNDANHLRIDPAPRFVLGKEN